jgi:hypothetical protein
MTPEYLTALTAARGLPIMWIPPGKGPYWTHAEAALASRGLDDRYFAAIQYVYALNDHVRPRLRVLLYSFAVEERERMELKASIPTLEGMADFYERPLVELLLCEWRQPWRFVRRDKTVPDLRRVVMNVSVKVWRAKLARLYGSIDAEFQKWVFTACSAMRAQLAA